jgi:hypothetical protein
VTIKETLNKLSESQKRQLSYAFENEFTQFVEYEPGKFVGVNVNHLKHLQVESSAGAWSTGSIKGKNDA